MISHVNHNKLENGVASGYSDKFRILSKKNIFASSLFRIKLNIYSTIVWPNRHLMPYALPLICGSYVQPNDIDTVEEQRHNRIIIVT